MEVLTCISPSQMMSFWLSFPVSEINKYIKILKKKSGGIERGKEKMGGKKSETEGVGMKKPWRRKDVMKRNKTDAKQRRKNRGGRLPGLRSKDCRRARKRRQRGEDKMCYRQLCSSEWTTQGSEEKGGQAHGNTVRGSHLSLNFGAWS